MGVVTLESGVSSIIYVDIGMLKILCSCTDVELYVHAGELQPVRATNGPTGQNQFKAKCVLYPDWCACCVLLSCVLLRFYALIGEKK